MALDPQTVGLLLMGAGQNPGQFAQMADQLKLPLPGSPEFQQLVQGAGTGSLGAALTGEGVAAGGPPPVGTQDVMRLASAAGGPQPAQPASPMAGAAPQPEQNQQQPQGQQAGQQSGVPPQIKAPQQQKPVFRAGVSGAQPAPTPNPQQGSSPAQALLAAIMGGQQQGGTAGGQVPSLGALLGG